MSSFRNIKMVITYASEILKAQGGHFPEIEALIQQANLDVQYFQWLLEPAERAQQSVQADAGYCRCAEVAELLVIGTSPICPACNRPRR